jgi:hypothetical protein
MTMTDGTDDRPDQRAFREAKGYLKSKSYDYLCTFVGTTGQFWIEESGYSFECLVHCEQAEESLQVSLFLVTAGSREECMVGFEEHYYLSPNGDWKQL